MKKSCVCLISLLKDWTVNRFITHTGYIPCEWWFASPEEWLYFRVAQHHGLYSPPYKAPSKLVPLRIGRARALVWWNRRRWVAHLVGWHSTSCLAFMKLVEYSLSDEHIYITESARSFHVCQGQYQAVSCKVAHHKKLLTADWFLVKQTRLHVTDAVALWMIMSSKIEEPRRRWIITRSDPENANCSGRWPLCKDTIAHITVCKAATCLHFVAQVLGHHNPNLKTSRPSLPTQAEWPTSVDLRILPSKRHHASILCRSYIQRCSLKLFSATTNFQYSIKDSLTSCTSQVASALEITQWNRVESIADVDRSL